jgi:hypothetical protein
MDKTQAKAEIGIHANALMRLLVELVPKGHHCAFTIDQRNQLYCLTYSTKEGTYEESCPDVEPLVEEIGAEIPYGQ